MTVLNRYRVSLTGFPGGPGVATFYSLDTATFNDGLKSLWTGLASQMPSDVVVTFPPDGDQIEDTTGEIVGSWLAAAGTPVSGLGVGNYSAPAGGSVRWITAAIVAGKRVSGRTFVVPMAGATTTNGGQIAGVSTAAMVAAANDFVASQSASFVVWSRPFPGAPAVPPSPGHPAGKAARAARPGSHHIVVGALVPSKVTVLRSRRD